MRIPGGNTALAATLAFAVVAVSACARDRASETPDAPLGQQPQPMPPPSSQPAPAPTPAPTHRPVFTPRIAPSATASAPPPMTSAETAELFHAQDACLSNCDQFACMRIAGLYREGSGLPRDPLAGRRYALHACLECGVAGAGIEEQCPSYGITPKKK